MDSGYVNGNVAQPELPSAALVMVEAVTGEVPFVADTTLGTLMARVDRPLVVPDELGPLPEGANAFERCNLWLLDTAQAYGAERLRFICLWDGGGGDGPGGTAHMVDEVRRHSGQVIWIDTRTL